MITPFTKDNKVDYDGVKALLSWYKQKGCDGIFAICQSSEIFFLSFEEKLELLKFIMKNKPEGLCIIASGNTSEDNDEIVEHAKQYIDTGIDAYVFISNRFAKQEESDEVFLENVFDVINRLPDIALGIYECPYPYNRLLSPEIIKELSNTGKFRFLKDTCCNISEIERKIKAAGDSGFGIYNANSSTLLESLKLGCVGFSGVMGNFHPELYVELCKVFKSDPKRAELIQNFVGFSSVVERQVYPVNAKYHLSLDGVPIGYDSRTRNAAELTESARLEIDQLYAITQLFKEYIGLEN